MPLPTTGLKAHFKASVGVTESSGRVSAWADQSGNGFDLAQATSGNQPLLVADGNFMNGTIPVIRFTEARADTMFRNTTPTNQTPPYCYAAVCRILANSTYNWMWGSNDSFRCIGMDSSNSYVMFNGNVVGLTGAGTSPRNNTMGLLIGNFDGASSHLFWNGRDSGAVDSGAGTSGNLGLRVGGGGSGAGDTGEFDIAELFYWDHALDATELDDLHEYVVDTYGPLFTARFRSDMEVTDAGAGAVSAWGDMGPGGFDLAQATSGERPTLVNDIINGQRILRFTRAGGSNLARASTPVVSIVPFSFAVYFTGLVAHTGDQWLITTNDSYRGVLFDPSERPTMFAGDTEFFDATAVDGNPHSIVANLLGGTDAALGYIDGVAGSANPITVNSGGGAGGSGIRIGDPTSGGEISIDVAEALLFDHALSTYEVAWLQDYFVERYETPPVLNSDGVGAATFDRRPYYDTFNRANGALGSNWDALETGGGAVADIESNEAQGIAGGATWSYWDANAIQADQFSSITIGNDTDGSGLGPAVRMAQGDGGSAYYLFLTSAEGGFATIWKLEDGGFTQLGSSIVIGSLAAGQVFRLEAEGTSIRSYKNGTLLDTVTNAALTTGQPGFIINNNASIRIDFWEGDAFGEEASGSFGDGDLASDGVATVAFAGGSVGNAVVASDGVATAAFTGVALSDAALASTAVGAAAFVGAYSVDGVLQSVGEGAAAFVGAANAGILQSDGIGAAAFVGAQTIAAVWLSDGVATASFSSVDQGAFAIEGIATVEWVSRAVGGSYWYEESAVDNTWTPEAGI